MPLSIPPSVPHPSGRGAAAPLTPTLSEQGGGKGGDGAGAGWSVGSVGLRGDCVGMEEPLGMGRGRHPCAALQHPIMVQKLFICRSVSAAESEGLRGGRGGKGGSEGGEGNLHSGGCKTPVSPFPK